MRSPDVRCIPIAADAQTGQACENSAIGTSEDRLNPAEKPEVMKADHRRDAVTDDDRPVWRVVAKGAVLEIAYGRGEVIAQYGALHLDSGFLRLNTGPHCDWGTSIIVLPSYWDGGIYRQGGPVATNWHCDGPDCIVAFEGSIGALHVHGGLRFRPPMEERFEVEVEVEATDCPTIDTRRDEAFKPVMLSSMRVADDLWDTDAIVIGDRTIDLAHDGWLIDPVASSLRFALRGGKSRWKRLAPTITIELERDLPIAGWKTKSADPDDDNIGIWAATDRVLPRWRYRVIATTGQPSITTASNGESHMADPDPSAFLLAEYKEMRGEILKRSEFQHQLISFALVALAGLAGLGLKEAPLALLAYPLVVAFLATSWAYNDIQIAQLGIYIRYRIEVPLAGTHGWEQFIASLAASKSIGALVKLATRGVFWGSEILMLVLYVLKRSSLGEPPLPEFFGGDSILFLVSVAAILFTLYTLRNRDTEVGQIREQAERPATR
jgi:hypothetical protein